MEEIKCPSCGSPNVEQIDVNGFQCPYCGKSFTTHGVTTSQKSQFDYVQNSTSDIEDKPGCLINGLCFLIPLLGIILYFVKRDTLPNCAKSYLTWSIVGIVVNVFLNLTGFWDGFWEAFYGY